MDPTVIKPVPTKTEELADIPGRMMAIRASQAQVGTVEWVTRHPDTGDPLNLTQFQSPNPSSSITFGELLASLGSAVPDTSDCVVKACYREALMRTPERLILDASIVSAEAGTVRFPLPSRITDVPAVYTIEVGYFYPPGHENEDRLMFSNQLYLLVEKGGFGTGAADTSNGPPSIQEIKLALRDSSPEDSYLNDKMEWDAAEVCLGLVRSVQWWNECPPDVSRKDTRNFPFREAWKVGVISYLYELAAAFYRREAVSFSAAGVALNDRAKAPEYEQKAQQLQMQFKKFVKSKKCAIDRNSVYGVVKQNYPMRGPGWGWWG